MTYVISAYKEGGPNDGEVFAFGPFDEREDADNAASEHLPPESWQVELCELRQIDEAAIL